MIEITIQRPGAEERTVSHDEETIRIGRDPGNDLVLDGAGCSRFHAEIREADGEYRIVDLGSTNGLRVDGEKVSELALTHGATVAIGETTLRFSLHQSTLPKTAVISFGDVEASREEGDEPGSSGHSAQPFYLIVPRGRKVENVKVALGPDYVIGRSPNADIVLDDKKSSLEHAQLSARDGHFVLRDLGSSNGTLLRGEPVDEVQLAPGDTFVVGETAITLSDRRIDLSDEATLMDKTQAAIRVPTPPTSTADDAAEASPAAPLSSGFEGRRGPRPLLVAVVVLGLAVAAIAFWWLRRAPAEESAETAAPAAEVDLRVAVGAVARKQLASVVAGSGNVKPLEDATVSSEVGGRVLSMNVSVGSAVSSGAVLAKLNDRDFRLQIDEARSSVSKEQVDLAREDYERKQRLFDERVVTRSVVDASKNSFLALESAYDTSRARIRQLEEQLSKSTIRAPFSGVVVRTFVSAGELIGPGSPVVQLEDQSSMVAELEVPDRDIVRVSLGMPVRATVDAFPGRVFEGEVTTVGTTANPATRSFAVEAEIENADGGLRSGMIARLELVLAEREGLAAPSDALLEQRDDRAVVFEVVDGVARRRTVTLGQRDGRETEIVDGVEEGALLVVSGQERLSDGDPVTVYRDDG